MMTTYSDLFMVVRKDKEGAFEGNMGIFKKQETAEEFCNLLNAQYKNQPFSFSYYKIATDLTII